MKFPIRTPSPRPNMNLYQSIEEIIYDLGNPAGD